MSGIVLDDSIVALLANRAYKFLDGESVAVETAYGPAHAQAAASRVLGCDVRFSGMNLQGEAVYRV